MKYLLMVILLTMSCLYADMETIQRELKAQKQYKIILEYTILDHGTSMVIMPNGDVYKCKHSRTGDITSKTIMRKNTTGIVHNNKVKNIPCKEETDKIKILKKEIDILKEKLKESEF